MLATLVLPVPGGPTNTKWRIGGSVEYPASLRSLAASIEAAIERTCSFTGARPIMLSSSPSASSTEIGGGADGSPDAGRGRRACRRGPGA